MSFSGPNWQEKVELKGNISKPRSKNFVGLILYFFKKKTCFVIVSLKTRLCLCFYYEVIATAECQIPKVCFSLFFKEDPH